MRDDIPRLIDRLGGLAATHELYSAGFTRSQLVVLLRERRIRRVRQGWYARPGLHPDLLQAARVGGRLTCASALELHGVWSPPHTRLHVAVPPNACQLRSPRSATQRLDRHDVRVHWHRHECASRLIVTAVDALLDLAECAPPEMMRACADSAIRQRPHLRATIASALPALPAAHRHALLRADAICESGIESLFHERMRRMPHLRRQVPIAPVGRVDFVIGERLVVEVDGFEYHSDREQFESDRRRDAVLSSMGYRVLRFSYRQVIDRWDEVEAAVWAAVARGDPW